jgi:hypothetical protein
VAESPKVPKGVLGKQVLPMSKLQPEEYVTRDMCLATYLYISLICIITDKIRHTIIWHPFRRRRSCDGDRLSNLKPFDTQ